MDGDLTQGSSDRRFDVRATLWFGTTEIAVEDITVSVGVSRAHVRVTSDHGRLVGERLGESSTTPPGIKPNAGGVWLLTDPSGGILSSKVLGDEPLCRIETPPNLPAHAKVQVSVDWRDLVCEFGADTPISPATESVMAIFLANALLQPESGRLILSEAEMRKDR